MNSAPKNTVATERTAIIRVNSIERLRILRVPFLVPRASSSATRRVTAVHMPEVAKVAAKTYTLKISW